MRTLFRALILLAGTVRIAAAQGVVVTPHAMVIDHRSRSTAITIYNPGSTPAEVSIGTFFGYPVTDSAGDFQLATPDSTSQLPSASTWIDAYPRRVVLGPLERQTVRLLARPPASLPDGEYWSRVMISAKGGKVAIAGADSLPTGIQVGLDLEVRTILPLQYRKGNVTTGIAIETPRTRRTGDSLEVRARIVRQGNAAFVGTARGSLVGEDNAVKATFAVPLAVYTEIDPRFAFDVRALPAGRYRLTLSLAAERTDLPAEQLVPGKTQAVQLSITLP